VLEEGLGTGKPWKRPGKWDIVIIKFCCEKFEA